MYMPAMFWGWAGVAVIFAIIEFFTVTFFGLWMAIAALIPCGLVLLYPEVSMITQLFIWVIASLCCAFIWVKWIRSAPARYHEESLSGQTGVLASALTPGETGILLLSKPVQGKQEWPCISSVAMVRQSRVKVAGITDDGLVQVVPVDTTK